MCYWKGWEWCACCDKRLAVCNRSINGVAVALCAECRQESADAEAKLMEVKGGD